MGKKLFGRKIIIAGLTMLLVIVGIILVMSLNTDTKNPELKNPGVETEQNAESDKNGEDGLQIQEDGDEVAEDSSDASGSWEDDSTDGASVGQDNNKDGSKGEDAAVPDNGNGNDDEGKQEEDENTLIDDKIWGDIF